MAIMTHHDNDFMKMEMKPTCTGPTIAGMSSVEQSVRFDILAPGLNFNTRFTWDFMNFRWFKVS